MTRGQRGRLIGRVLLAIAFGTVGLAIYLFIAVPGNMGPDPMTMTPPEVLGLPTGLVVLSVGIVGVVVGLVWMIRIYRADPEPDQHAWRYRSRDHDVDRDLAAARLAMLDVDPDHAGGLTPGQRGRWIGRAMIAGACVAIASVAYLYVEITSGTSPMFRTPPDLFGLPVADVVAMAGLLGAIVGMLLMVRIHRADPEPDQHAWRYRSRGH